MNLGKVFTFADLALVPLAGILTAVILSAKSFKRQLLFSTVHCAVTVQYLT